jgi:hypothetical protein
MQAQTSQAGGFSFSEAPGSLCWFV